MSDDLKEMSQRKLSFGQTLKAVAWSFFGVRKGKDFDQDTARINPVHVIIAGLLAGILFVLLLVLAARWIVSSGIAAS